MSNPNQQQTSGPAQGARSIAQETRPSGLRLGSLFGIEVRLDPSVLLIFMLIVYSLAVSVFPGWHPEWGPALRWGTALVAGLLFFASLLAHEFAHSVVAQAYGLRVPRITLFLLGGVSELSAEPRTPKSELLMALAGPAMSLALGIAFSIVGATVAGDDFAERLVRERASALATLSPLATMLLWLGPVNLMLAVFNMLPGFPLDGGRVLRATLWWLGGDRLRATRWASDAGRMFGWGFMALGAWTLLSGGGFGGLWFVLIGWFLSSSAGSSYRQLWLQEALKDLDVTDLMRTRFEVTAPSTPIASFIDEQLLRGQQRLWPVLDGEALVGWINQGDVAGLGGRDRSGLCVIDLMHAPEALPALTPATTGSEAMTALAANHDDTLPVVDDGQVVGLLAAADVMRWLSLHGGQGVGGLQPR